MAIDDRTDTRPPAPIHDEHWCEHPGCNKWGGLGFARSMSERPRWWCSKHYPHWTDAEQERRTLSA